MGCELITALADLRGRTFGTIYADPPWLYGNQSTRGATSDHYEGMTVDEIAAMPIAGLAAQDAHLHLWTTNAFLPHSFAIIEAWGFTYKSMLLWVKPQIGMGNYWRVSHELLLLGTRGKATFGRHDMRSWVEADRTRHSHKPDCFRRMIEDVSPAPRLELFGRQRVEGWTVFGNQVETMGLFCR